MHVVLCGSGCLLVMDCCGGGCVGLEAVGNVVFLLAVLKLVCNFAVEDVFLLY